MGNVPVTFSRTKGGLYFSMTGIISQKEALLSLLDFPRNKGFFLRDTYSLTLVGFYPKVKT